MISAHILTEVAGGRRGSLLAEAAAARAVREATLRTYDRADVLIRPIRPDDAALLRDGFARLSEQSRRLRFLTPKNDLSDAEVGYLTDVDHVRHEALVAVDRVDGRGIAVARYVRDADAPEAADIAVTVVDDWQGRGLGIDLLVQLMRRARQAGICRFTAMVAAENIRARRALRRLTPPVRLVGREGATLFYEIALMPGCGG